jgi:hypothetical protein
MSRTFTSFALVTVLAGLLTALCLAVGQHGYPFGAVGAKRLDDIAGAATFLPLAAVYFFSAMLMMVLPIRAAGFVLANAADALFWTTVVLFATIVGNLIARWAFGQGDALWLLWNWRFLFVAAVVACHLGINDLRRNVLLRSLFLVVFAAAVLACLFWTFRA